MPARKLHNTLDELHAQLEAADKLDEGERAHLIAAMDEIRAVLARPEDAGAEPAAVDGDAGPVARLKELVEHFEEEHPLLSRRLADLAETLHGMGF